MSQLSMEKMLMDAFEILEKEQSTQACQDVLIFLAKILQQDDVVSLAFTISEGRLCMGLKRMIFHRDPAIQMYVMNILNSLIQTYNNNNNLNNIPDFNQLACGSGSVVIHEPLMRIPAILIEAEMLHVVSELLNTLDPQLFDKILIFLEQLCIASTCNAERFIPVLESTLRLGVIRIKDENFHKTRLIQFYLILLMTMTEIPSKIQQQIITYYTSLPDQWNSPHRLFASNMIKYCVDPLLKDTVDKLVDETIGFANHLENNLYCRVGQDLDTVAWAFQVANGILVEESQYVIVPLERRIRLRLFSMLPFLQHSLIDLSQYHFLCSALRMNLKSSIIMLDESTADDETLKVLMINFLFYMQSFFEKLVIREQQDLLWCTMYELFGFVERRRERQEVGSLELVHCMILQPWMEQMVLSFISAQTRTGMTGPPQSWHFTQSFLLFIQKWIDMIDMENANCPNFAQITKTGAGQPTSIANLCHALYRTLVAEVVMQVDLSQEHETLVMTVKQKLKALMDKFDIL